MEIISHGAVKDECPPNNNLNVVMNFDIVNLVNVYAQGSITGETGLLLTCLVSFGSIFHIGSHASLLYLLHIHVQLQVLCLAMYVGTI